MSRPSATRHIEQEARFLIGNLGVYRALTRLRTLEGFAFVKGKRESQRNTYFDTSGWRLRRGGSVLKWRTVGRRHELIFKQLLGHRDAVLRHREVSVHLASVDPQRIARLVTTEPVRLALRVAGRAPLKPLVTIRTDRRRRVFAVGRQRVEFDVDRVRVYDGSRIAGERCEVEVENLNARPQVFAEAMAVLQRKYGRGALRASTVSKLEFALGVLRKRRRKLVTV